MSAGVQLSPSMPRPGSQRGKALITVHSFPGLSVKVHTLGIGHNYEYLLTPLCTHCLCLQRSTSPSLGKKVSGRKKGVCRTPPIKLMGFAFAVYIPMKEY